MNRSDLFLFATCVVAWSITPACSSSSDDSAAGTSDGGAASGDDAAATNDAGNHGDSSTHDAGKKDAAATDAGSLNGWTAESGDEAILLATGTSVTALLADPSTPRSLLLRMQTAGEGEGATIDMTWTDGVLGQAMPSPGPAGAALIFARGGTSSFGADGNVYEVIDFPSAGRVAVQLEQRSASTLNWITVAPELYSWPPRDVLVMPGAPTRVFLQTDAELVEATATTPTSFPTGYFGSISLSPDRTTYLAVSNAGLEKCTLATGSCAAVTTTGIADGDAPSQVWIDPVDGSRVFLSTSNGTALHFYTATDGGTAFTAVPLPSSPTWGAPIFAPSVPSTLAVQLAATESSPGGISVTTDSGAHWKDIAPPDTPITDVSGLAFDAAGALFLVRNGTLYSRSTFE